MHNIESMEFEFSQRGTRKNPPVTATVGLPGKRRCASSCAVNEDGQTKLHRLCQSPHACRGDVEYLLAEDPDSSSTVDVFGRTPIFYALKWACSLDVVELLFNSYPAGVTRQDFCGESGLYLLYHPSKCPTLLECCLRKEPSLALHKSNSFSGRRLFENICEPWRINDVVPSADDDAWAKLLLTVEAAHTSVTGSDRSTLENDEQLHIALELDLSASLICHFVTLYPQQVRRPMTRRGGLLPLHFVIARRNIINSRGGGALIRSLVAAFPRAATLTLNGQYPLHIALKNGCKWIHGVQDVVNACHEALHVRDPESEMCPLMIAAEVGDLDTIFSLLQNRPYFHCGGSHSHGVASR